MTERKNPVAVQIGQRIKQARKMAGFSSAARLLEEIPEWGTGRLGNYEAGISLPSPEDIMKIADVTSASPCWIMFGHGPIRSRDRDIQAIRHQNLVFLHEFYAAQRGGTGRFLKATGIARKKLDQHRDDPFLEISNSLARKSEKFAGKPAGWMDEQHVESDPVCAAFPDDMRRIMQIYSNLDTEKRQMLLRIAEVIDV